MTWFIVILIISCLAAIAITAAVVVLIIKLASKIQGEPDHWARYSKSRGYQIGTEEESEQIIPPSLRALMHLELFGAFKPQPIITGSVRQLGFKMARRDFYYKSGVNDNAGSWSFVYAVMTLKRSYPHALLVPVIGAEANTIESKLSGYINTELEGNFNEYYRVLVKPKDAVTIRELLQPDVMQVIIDNKGLFIDVFENQICFYGPVGTFLDDAFVDKLLATASSVTSEVID